MKDWEKIVKAAKVTLVEDYDDGRPDIYRVENKKARIAVDVEAKDVAEARKKALENLKNMPEL